MKPTFKRVGKNVWHIYEEKKRVGLISGRYSRGPMRLMNAISKFMATVR